MIDSCFNDILTKIFLAYTSLGEVELSSLTPADLENIDMAQRSLEFIDNNSRYWLLSKDQSSIVDHIKESFMSVKRMESSALSSPLVPDFVSLAIEIVSCVESDDKGSVDKLFSDITSFLDKEQESYHALIILYGLSQVLFLYFKDHILNRFSENRLLDFFSINYDRLVLVSKIINNPSIIQSEIFSIKKIGRQCLEALSLDENI